MIRCLDIHTHHTAPCPEAVVACGPSEFSPIENQRYSIGIHPWNTVNEISPSLWRLFESYCERPEVVAIGEAGIDTLKGGLLFKQMIIFRRQIDLSENLHKPLIIHDVRAHDIIVGLRREMKPAQNWVIHGFRGKPTVAKMLIDCGIWLSFGEKFNFDSLKNTPREMMLAETDESKLSIHEIINNLSAVTGFEMSGVIADNTSRFLAET